MLKLQPVLASLEFIVTTSPGDMKEQQLTHSESLHFIPPKPFCTEASAAVLSKRETLDYIIHQYACPIPVL